MRFILMAAALAFAMLPGCSSTVTKGVEASRSIVPLTISTKTGERRFRVEVARSEEEQARGLMFREQLPNDGGMIFPMNPPRIAGLWMKNTLIPLDMIFIRADGTIARIAAETVPHSLESVTSGEPVAAVLEIGGGRAAALGIAEEDRVSWPR
jgi:uncharacterized protein